MEYNGDLYGKVGGMVFKTGKTSKNWDDMEARLKELEAEILALKQANGVNTEQKALHIDSVVCSALSDEIAAKMLVHCPYEKSGWCVTKLKCRFKLENCDAKGNGCELAL